MAGNLLECLLHVGGLYVAVFLLNLLVPATRVVGYAQDAKGKPLIYALNGFRVHILVAAVFLALGYWDLYDVTFFCWNYPTCALAACLIGLAATGYFHVRGPFPGHTTAPKVKATRARAQKLGGAPLALLHDAFFGVELNPRWPATLGLFDFKMFLYLVGAVMVQVNLLSAAFVHVRSAGSGELSPAMMALVVELSYFLCEYLYFEHVHLYTYDIFDENIGFKLTWGCLCWYGFFYAAPAMVLADPSLQVERWQVIASVMTFCLGYPLTRGANLQKYYFKIDPKQKAFGIIKPESIGGKVLCSGFWGLSRHINYLGEILLATGIALSTGFNSVVPWLYPLYYLALLFPRERDDDLRCEQKYGKLWVEYRRRVPYRIIPYVY